MTIVESDVLFISAFENYQLPLQSGGSNMNQVIMVKIWPGSFCLEEDWCLSNIFHQKLRKHVTVELILNWLVYDTQYLSMCSLSANWKNWMAIIAFCNWLILTAKVKYDFLYEKEHICCLEEWSSPTHQKIYTTFILVTLFLLPLLLLLVLYGKIGYELWIKKRVGDDSALQTLPGREMFKIARSVYESVHQC